jgi:hypothetical protein
VRIANRDVKFLNLGGQSVARAQRLIQEEKGDRADVAARDDQKRLKPLVA